MHGRVKLDQLAVLAAARYDAAVFQRAHGEHRPFVHVSRHLGDVVCACVHKTSGKYTVDEGAVRLGRRTLTASPGDDGPVRIAGQDVTVLRERQTRHVLRTVPSGLEYAVALVQGAARVQCPETYVTLAAGHDLVAFQRMEFRGYHRVHGTLYTTHTRVHYQNVFQACACVRPLFTTTNLGLRDLVTLLVLLPVPHGYVMVVSFVDGAQKAAAVLF